MTEKNELPSELIKHTAWENESNPIWPVSVFTLHRNLSHYHFPSKLSSAHFEHALSSLSENLLKSSLLKNPSFFRAETLSANKKDLLFEHFLCTEGFQNTLSGQGFIIDESSTFLALINIEDHLQMQLISSQSRWQAAWNTLSSIELALGKVVEYAFSPHFGYLTSDPRLCGTGLIVRVYLHLPALIHTGQLSQTLQKQKEEGIHSCGLGGAPDEFFGDLLVLYNSYTLGLSEEAILHDVHSTAMKFVTLEKTLRSHLKDENNLDMKDQISRAYGLLLHSYQLQTQEALNALSLIKLGLDLNWVEGTTDSALNTLFFQCRRAHLSRSLKEDSIDQQEIARKRAEFIHPLIQSLTLKIDQ